MRRPFIHALPAFREGPVLLARRCAHSEKRGTASLAVPVPVCRYSQGSVRYHRGDQS
jgi:hypothetical protein